MFYMQNIRDKIASCRDDLCAQCGVAKAPEAVDNRTYNLVIIRTIPDVDHNVFAVITRKLNNQINWGYVEHWNINVR
jgi:hypothetical protein